MRRSERIHLPVDVHRAAAITETALGLDADLSGTLPGSAQSRLVARVTADDAGALVILEATNETHLPFFQGIFVLIFRWELKRSLRWCGKSLEAGATGGVAPEPLRSHPFATPGHFTPDAATLIATVAFAGLVTAFAAALFGQLGDPVAKTFDISNQGLGEALAITRLGALVALVAGVLADRIGRRRILLVAIVVLCAGNAVSAIAPSFEIFTLAQIFVRAGVNTAFIVGGIAVVEEAPEGGRAFAVSMLALASGAGYAVSVVLLPLADVTPEFWRVIFGVSAASVVLVPLIARRMHETERFTKLAARTAARGRFREVVDSTYGPRLLLLASVGFLSNMFSAPSASFTNRFLSDERGFSNGQIAGLRGVTTGVPGLVGILLAGRLAESRGRRPVAIVGLLVGSLLTMAFFVSSGALLWIFSGLAVVAGASGTLSVGTMDAELFPTEVRGTANSLLLVMSVLGSATGLLLAGFLADRVGDLGIALAALGVAPVVAALFLLPRLPESSGRALDDVSPSEV